MADRVKMRSEHEILLAFRTELLREMRSEGARVRRAIRPEMRKKTGNGRRRLKLKVGVDSSGPYARIVTTAIRVSANKQGGVTSFRYGLAQQQKEHYLQAGLARTPRR
jgi:hypothetical protein